MKKNYQILLLTLVLLSIIGSSIKVVHADDDSSEMKTVLFLNSYHKGYKWSDDIYDGIKSILNSNDINLELQVEFMDTQRVTDNQYLQSLFDTYKYKFKNRHFDLIISSDEPAFNFLLAYGEVLFPDTPVVFCGVNYFEQNMLNENKLFTGVVEGFDISATIDIALEHQPNTNTIYYVNDDTTTGTSIMKEFSKVMPEYKDQLNFIKLDGVNLDEITKKAQNLPAGSIILYLVYFKDNEGNHYEYNQASSIISYTSLTPIYGVWDFTLGYGIIGGKLTSGFYQGETAATIAVSVLNGVAPSQIPVITEKTTHYQFDYVQLKKFGIKVDELPLNSIIINLEKTSKRQILILNSYNKGLKWTDDLEIGIKSALKDNLDNIEFTYEFMDVQKNTDPVYLQNLYELLVRKYKNKHFDLIITTDDVAFNFIKTYHNTIYATVPTIFCGVNFFEESMLAHKENFTGVVESYDLRGTIDVAIKINPSINKIIVINDTSVTGQANIKNLHLLIPDYSDRVIFEIWDDINMSEVQKKVETLKDDSIILLLSFNRDKSNNNFSYDESIQMISAHASVPIYGVWDFYLGKGLLGGVLTSGVTHGETVGQMALQILEGKNPSDIPVVINSPNIYMFDYNMLKKFNINSNSLPIGSNIINTPSTISDFYNNNKKLLIAFIYIFSALCIIVSLMYKNIRIRKVAEEKERLYALTDPLTKIPNRRAGMEHLAALLENPSNDKSQVTVCFIDINNLKMINDTFGHRSGDDVIKEICRLVTSSLRSVDMLCRFGGDEFLIIFNNISMEEVTQTLNKINEAITLYNQHSNKPYVIGISSGFSQYNKENCNNIDALIEQADIEMYKNKRLYREKDN
ncbi:MAG: hypothetical protein CVV02_11455 [Firmicutes bacterium HGW-Firmicutes-7]|nr:MAG: hypothetical protein CVV02_11455 [Firmicutes bacterium HGW-Firmicutes-7]